MDAQNARETLTSRAASVPFGMPGEAIAAELAELVLAIEEIGPAPDPRGVS